MSKKNTCPENAVVVCRVDAREKAGKASVNSVVLASLFGLTNVVHPGSSPLKN